MSDDDLSALWRRQWPECPPLAHDLKHAFRDRWVRFHSLPGSKRYPDTDAESASAYLGRVHRGVASPLRVRPAVVLRLVRGARAGAAVGRVQVELCVRWMQEVRRFKPSTVSRRMAVVTGFYRTCVIDRVVEHPPAEYVRRGN